MADFRGTCRALESTSSNICPHRAKTAQAGFAFHILRIAPEEMRLALADAIRDAQVEYADFARWCNNITDADPCLYLHGAHAQSQDNFASSKSRTNIMAHRKNSPVRRPVSRPRRERSRRCEASAPINLHLKRV